MKNRIFLFALFLIVSFAAQAQWPENSFPKNWEGSWEGRVEYTTTLGMNMDVYSALHVQSSTSDDTVSFTIVYGEDSADIREYQMIKGEEDYEWILDEQNGIEIQSYFIGNQLVNLFEVQGTLIMAMYELKEKEVLMQMFAYDSKELFESGLGTEESPEVNSYYLLSYSRAIMTSKK
ncbi:MAG: hypothetical protein JXR53_04115 [Bacteroidales bacterium]|nr:hypothetical protein [Bacteroidales bacterium]